MSLFVNPFLQAKRPAMQQEDLSGTAKCGARTATLLPIQVLKPFSLLDFRCAGTYFNEK